MQNTILSHEQIQNKIRRMAYQIYETNVDVTEIIIAGIADNGYILAERIIDILSQISDFEITLCKVSMHKDKPQGTVTTSIPLSAVENKSLVLVDDVLHSGTTLIYGVNYFLEIPLKRFKTAVLVNRNHKKYPIKADFKGISLSTSFHEHVKVIFSEKEDLAILQ